MQNLESTILSQYANSPAITSYINSLNLAIDPVNLVNAFYNDVWNITTASGHGLDIWGRIVGVNRVLKIPGTLPFFGFKEAGATGFGQNSLYTNAVVTQNYTLSDNAFRLLIMTKAYSNLLGASTYDYNQLLISLFPNRGNAYVSSTGNMTARLTFEFVLLPFEISILKYSGALTPPTGVSFNIMQYAPFHTFGFQESGPAASPFGQGTFFAGYS